MDRKLLWYTLWVAIFTAIAFMLLRHQSLLSLSNALHGAKGGALVTKVSLEKLLPQERAVKHIGATFERIQLHAKPGRSAGKEVVRKGYLFRRPTAVATVIMFHGFMCDKTDILFLGSMFKDYNLLAFDFRGHGEDTAGQCCTFGADEAFDVLAAVEFVRADQQMAKLPLIAYGFSMGAVSSIQAHAKFGPLFDCAIWDCPFDSTAELLARCISVLKLNILGYSFVLPGRKFLKKYAYNRYVQSLLKMALKTVANMDASQVETQMVPVDTVASAQKVSIPAYYIVCKNDGKAPPTAVRRLYDASLGFKRLWVTNGRRHFDSFFYNPDEYAHRIQKFIKKFLDGRLSKQRTEKIIYDPDTQAQKQPISL
ncbi:MAG: alpha/beta hydrolase [Candidatus Dependentiae bacterium]|nr:alpha/beta hydrolase [Candidatus Dependentiae bacterium]